MLDPFRAASVELALLDIYSSYKDGNTTPYLVARDGADAGRVWPLTGAAIGISPSGAVVGAPDAPGAVGSRRRDFRGRDDRQRALWRDDSAPPRRHRDRRCFVPVRVAA